MTAEFKKCWMLKIYTGEDVIVGNDPLYRTILEEARRLKIAGATVIKGIEGYATEVRGIDRRPVSLFTGVSNLPVLVTIVDQKENLEKLIPFLEKKALFFWGIFHAISGCWCGCPGCSNLFERISGFFPIFAAN